MHQLGDGLSYGDRRSVLNNTPIKAICFVMEPMVTHFMPHVLTEGQLSDETPSGFVAMTLADYRHGTYVYLLERRDKDQRRRFGA